MKTTYYDILGITQAADFEIVHAAYRALMLKKRKHPDLGGDTEEAKRINEAYSVLKDPAKRVQYDQKIGKTFEASSSMERRRVHRTSVDVSISYCLNHDTRWHSARVKDYSIVGIRLLSHEPIKKDQTIVVSCPNTASSVLNGVVRWVRMYCPSVFEKVYEAGIEFDSPVPDISQRITI